MEGHESSLDWNGMVVTDWAGGGRIGIFPSVSGQPIDSLGSHHRMVINTQGDFDAS
jgi:hypothetical protein